MKNKIIIFTIALLMMLGLRSNAQEQKPEEPKYGWQKEMVGGINLTQTSFDNWAQGGENSIAWQANLNFKFIDDQKNTNWANSGKLAYGSTKTGDQQMQKSIDEIKLETVLTYKLNLFVNPYVAGTAETQFAPGFNYTTEPEKTQLSAFMDPAYFRESVGVGYKYAELVKTRLGAAFKQTITSEYPIPYADDVKTLGKIEKTRTEIGGESVTDLSWKVVENTLFSSKLELFTNFQGFDEIDVNWDNILTTKISKFFNVNVNFKLFYDKNISPKRQIKQAIALGFSYNFL